jgi:hypothetical protein
MHVLLLEDSVERGIRVIAEEGGWGFLIVLNVSFRAYRCWIVCWRDSCNVKMGFLSGRGFDAQWG